MCTECKRKADGKSPFDAHHVAAKANRPVTLSTPANDHRAELTPAQQGWPRKTLENPDRSPVLAVAASNRGFTDTNAYLTEKLIHSNSELLEMLDAFLEEKLGRKWWEGTPLGKYAPKS